MYFTLINSVNAIEDVQTSGQIVLPAELPSVKIQTNSPAIPTSEKATYPKNPTPMYKAQHKFTA